MTTLSQQIVPTRRVALDKYERSKRRLVVICRDQRPYASPLPRRHRGTATRVQIGGLLTTCILRFGGRVRLVCGIGVGCSGFGAGYSGRAVVSGTPRRTDPRV